MKKLVNIINKKVDYTKVMASFALLFSVVAANSACLCFYHQPEKPDLCKLRKF